MRAASVLVVLASMLLLAPFAPRIAAADWPPFGRPLSTASGLQGLQDIAPDGAGGAIVAWQDRRTLPYGIFAQHVLASGELDAAWPIDGRSLMIPASVPSVVEGSEAPAIVSDGAGGAIVAFADGRIDLNGLDLFAQHVLASGAVDPTWPANGATVSATTGPQQDAAIVSDGAGGAIIAWVDGRAGSTINELDVYAQHLLASGVVDPNWPANGTALCTAPKAQTGLSILKDGSGGAIVTWADSRSGNPGVDIYAQRVLASGVVDPAWPVNGRAVCTAPGTQSLPTIITDGGTGAIIAWHDLRNSLFNQVFALRVLSSGAIAAGWPDNGRALAPTLFDQVSASPVPDGAGGAVIAWGDARTGVHNIRAQHLLASGAIDATWPASGAVLSVAPTEESFPVMVSDGAGGGIVTWQVNQDILAQHVLASGALDSTYPPDGRVLSGLPSAQKQPVIVAAGAGGAIVAWEDLRDGTDADVYALQVLAAGTTDVAPGTGAGDLAFARPSPNPARDAVTLRFALPREARVRLAIYDAGGRRVRELASGSSAAGEHALAWDLRDESGRAVGTGLYFARLEADGHTVTQKVAALR